MAKFSRQDIDDLKAILSCNARIILEDHENYKESIKRWSAAAEKPAAIIIFPKTAADISKAIKFAKTYKLELAVKCGGHATSGSSSTDGGLCIDLSLMREVSVNPSKRTIRAAGGALWSDIYAAGEAFGLACVGGAVDETGVGGLTLGGGYGYMSGAHGLVIDNLLEVEYVLADGSTLIASEHKNPDLFWAARGAGAGFGVATSFLFKAHKQEAPVWGGLLVFNDKQFNDVIKAANHFIDLNDEKGSLVISIMRPPPTFSMVVLALIYYNGTEYSARETFRSLLQLRPLADTTGFMPYPAINQLFSTSLTSCNMRHSMKGAAFNFPLSTSFASKLLEKLSTFVDDVPDAASSLITFEFFPYRKITSISQNATAFANRGPYGNLLSIISWRDLLYDNICRKWARDISAIANAEFFSSRREKTGVEEGVGEYFNYDGLETSGKFVFGSNYTRLVRLKKRYDPENLFCKGPRLVP